METLLIRNDDFFRICDNNNKAIQGLFLGQFERSGRKNYINSTSLAVPKHYVWLQDSFPERRPKLFLYDGRFGGCFRLPHRFQGACSTHPSPAP